MNPKTRNDLIGAAAMSLIIVSAGIAQTPMQYKGRIFATEFQFKVKIDAFSTPEEINKIKEPLKTQNYEAFYKALWSMDKGQIQFIGTDRTNVHFQLAVEIPTEKGVRILLIADNRAVVSRMSTTDWGLRPMYIVELTLDKKYKGEGRMHVAATITFTDSGGVDLGTYMNEPQMLTNVHAVK